MDWRDFFYFSTGERRALTILLCLLSTLWLFQSISQYHQKEIITQTTITKDTIQKTFSTISVKTAKEKTMIKAETLSVKHPNPPHKKQFYTPKEKKYPTYSSNKYKEGTIIELNNADTTILKKIPGIGTSYSKRIVKYRKLLGGFYSVTQLKEVYGIDDEKYQNLKNWFYTDTTFIQKININKVGYLDLIRHPYLNKEQTKAIYNLRKQKSRLSGWESLLLLKEFSTNDVEKLSHYLSFE